MKHLFKGLKKIKDILEQAYIMLFLDYDGTLTPIAKRPQDAVMPSKTRQMLQGLAGMPGVKLAIISGRQVEDVKKLVGLKEIIYVGNHGFEIEGPKVNYINHSLSKYKIVLRQIKEELEKKLFNIKGVFIEDKGITLAVHYRLANKKDIPLIKAIFQETLIFCCIKNKVRTRIGKMLLEARPATNWDKGKAVLWLLAKQRFAAKKQAYPVYIGDDKTDEDAFKALKNRGLAIFVGEPRYSNAKYYLKNTDEVLEFLRYVRLNKGKRAV